MILEGYCRKKGFPGSSMHLLLLRSLSEMCMWGDIQWCSALAVCQEWRVLQQSSSSSPGLATNLPKPHHLQSIQLPLYSCPPAQLAASQRVFPRGFLIWTPEAPDLTPAVVPQLFCIPTSAYPWPTHALECHFPGPSQKKHHVHSPRTLQN